MKDVLCDPIAVKKKEDGEFPWSFKAPSYDNRTSCSMPAGDYYGVGRVNPIGKKSASMKNSPIPQKAKCFSPNEIFKHEDKKG